MNHKIEKRFDRLSFSEDAFDPDFDLAQAANRDFAEEGFPGNAVDQN